MIDRELYEEIVKQQIKTHPATELQDLIKLCYQGCYGPSHNLEDKEKAYRYFMEEYNKTEPKDGMIAEHISEEYVRINFAPYKMANLPPRWLFEMFRMTTLRKAPGGFEECLEVIGDMIAGGDLPFSQEEWTIICEEHKRAGRPAVHHTEAYREKEDPHYRVVETDYEKMIPILLCMNQKQSEGKRQTTFKYETDAQGELIAIPMEGKQAQPLVLAIEGRAASGKTTMAKDLATIVGAPIVEMDHFFVPKSLQKPRRLQQPGGNIHYERFLEEVIPFIKEDVPFEYTIYDCHVGGPVGKKLIEASEWRIVEGVYSLHPNFGDYADVKVFVDVGPEEQMRRIRQRNGLEMAKIFREKWIPMEEAYFHVNSIEKQVDCIYDTTYKYL